MTLIRSLRRRRRRRETPEAVAIRGLVDYTERADRQERHARAEGEHGRADRIAATRAEAVAELDRIAGRSA